MPPRLGKEHAIRRLADSRLAREPVPAADGAERYLESPVLGSAPCKGNGNTDTEDPERRYRSQKKDPGHRLQTV